MQFERTARRIGGAFAEWSERVVGVPVLDLTGRELAREGIFVSALMDEKAADEATHAVHGQVLFVESGEQPHYVAGFEVQRYLLEDLDFTYVGNAAHLLILPLGQTDVLARRPIAPRDSLAPSQLCDRVADLPYVAKTSGLDLAAVKTQRLNLAQEVAGEPTGVRSHGVERSNLTNKSRRCLSDARRNLTVESFLVGHRQLHIRN